jgi:hypothetical protein
MKGKIYLLFATLLFATQIMAHDFVVDGISYNITSVTKREVEVTSNTVVPYADDIVIPDSVKYNGRIFYVTAVGDYAFLSSARVNSIKIGSKVKYIGKSAFEYCLNLVSIDIPEGVTTIGNGAFNGCSKLLKIELPSTVESIGFSAFKHCSSIETITIPEKVPNIDNNTFYECTKLTTLYLSNPETIVGEHAFFGCPHKVTITVLEKPVEEPAATDSIAQPAVTLTTTAQD